MIKLNKGSAKAVLILHFCTLTLWLGGAISCLPLLYQADLSRYDETYATYLHMRAIAWNVIGWGGIGSFFTGLVLALFTEWGLFKHKWVMAKFFLVIALIMFGMFFNEHRMLENIELLEVHGVNSITNATFLQNHTTLKGGMLASTSGFILLIAIAVYKPWMKKKHV